MPILLTVLLMLALVGVTVLVSAVLTESASWWDRFLDLLARQAGDR